MGLLLTEHKDEHNNSARLHHVFWKVFSMHSTLLQIILTDEPTRKQLKSLKETAEILPSLSSLNQCICAVSASLPHFSLSILQLVKHGIALLL